MRGMTVKVKTADGLIDMPAHWEPVAAFDAPSLSKAGNAMMTGEARKQVVPDAVDGIRFKRVIGAAGYEFEAYRHIPTRRPNVDIIRHRSGLL